MTSQEQKLEALKARQILNRRFIVLRKVYIFGIFPKLLCILRDDNDGYVTEKRIPFRIRKGESPIVGGLLNIKLGDTPMTFLITKEAYDWLNFYDKPVFYQINNPEPWLEGYVIKGESGL